MGAGQVIDEQTPQVRRIVKVAILCMALAIVIALASAAHGQTSDVGPVPTTLTHKAFAPIISK